MRWFYEKNGKLFSTPGYFPESTTIFLEITLNFSAYTCMRYDSWDFRVEPTAHMSTFEYEDFNDQRSAPVFGDLVNSINSRIVGYHLIFAELSNSNQDKLTTFANLPEFDENFRYTIHSDSPWPGVIKEFGSGCDIDIFPSSVGWYRIDDGELIPSSHYGYISRNYQNVRHGEDYFYKNEFQINNLDGCVGFVIQGLVEKIELRN